MSSPDYPEPPSSPASSPRPFAFPEDLPKPDPASPYMSEAEMLHNREHYEHVQLSGLELTAHGFSRWGGGLSNDAPDTPSSMAREERQQAEARAVHGGLPDAVDTPRSVSQTPFKF